MNWTKNIPTIGGMPVTHILGVMKAKKKRKKDNEKKGSYKKETETIFSEEEIKGKIDEELRRFYSYSEKVVKDERRAYEKFKKEILYWKLNSLEDYAYRVLTMGSEGYEGDLVFYLIKLLKENNFPLSIEEIVDELKKIAKEVSETYVKEKRECQLFPDKFEIPDLDTFKDYTLEGLLEGILEAEGFEVEKKRLSKAYFIVNKYGRVVVQVKRYIPEVDDRAVQEVIRAVKYYKADRGMLISTNKFTPQATELAKLNNIELMDGDKLKKLGKELYIRKYNNAVFCFNCKSIWGVKDKFCRECGSPINIKEAISVTQNKAIRESIVLELPKSHIVVTNDAIIKTTQEGRIVGKHNFSDIHSVCVIKPTYVGCMTLVICIVLSVVSKLYISHQIGSWVACIAFGLMALGCIFAIGTYNCLQIKTKSGVVLQYVILENNEEAEGFVVSLQEMIRKKFPAENEVENEDRK